MAENFAKAKFMTVTEVADMMRVSRMTVYRMIHAGDLPAARFKLLSCPARPYKPSSPHGRGYWH